jgi:hypothetical protein
MPAGPFHRLVGRNMPTTSSKWTSAGLTSLSTRIVMCRRTATAPPFIVEHVGSPEAELGT